MCVVSLSGSLTGCVGDLGLGLTNGGETTEGADFFSVGFLSVAGVADRFTSGSLPAVFGWVEDVGAGLVVFALSAPFRAGALAPVPATLPRTERSLLPPRSRASSVPLS